MKKLAALFTAILAIVAISCDHNEYVIELVPHGQEMERTLTVGHVVESSNAETQAASQPAAPHYGEFEANELAAISKLYPASTPIGDTNRVKFTGKFKDAMPNDAGSKGRYVCFETLLGSTYAYLENFRGNDDLVGQLDRRYKQADRLVDLTIGWAKQEFGSKKGFDKLQQFLDQDLRKDLKNISLYTWQFASVRQNAYLDANTEKNAQNEIAARAFQYLEEREYITTADIPSIGRIIEESTDKASVTSTSAFIISKVLAKKAGLEGTEVHQAIVAAFQPAKQQEELLKSMNTYLATTDEYKKLLAAWEVEKAKNKDGTEPNRPDPMSVATSLLDPLINPHFEIADSRDALVMSLATNAEPLATNGTWDANTGKITWNHRLLARDEQNLAPLTCYAVWANADAAFQKAHFGQTVLTGKELIEYCLWRKGLTQAEGDRWDKLLMDLKPGKDAIEKLQKFSVAATQPTGNTPASSEYIIKEVGSLVNALAPTTQPAEKK